MKRGIVEHEMEQLLRSLAALLAFASFAFAQVTGSDIVVLKTGRHRPSLRIVSETFEQIGIDTTGDETPDEFIKTEEVAEVRYGDRTSTFLQAQRNLERCLYEEAAKKFAEALAEKEPRQFWLRQLGNYLLGECYRMLGETQPARYADALRSYEAVWTAQADGRMVPPAKRDAGRCLMAQGKLDEAEKFFAELTSGKYGPFWANHGKIWTARLRAAQKKFDEALALCREVSSASQGLNEEIRLEANFCRAEILSASGKHEEAQAIYQSIADSLDEKFVDLKARAYNGIGDVFLAQGRVKEALMAYLHVVVLYFESGAELPRAKYQAAFCFGKLREPARARDLYQELIEEFPNTTWAAKAKLETGGK